MGAKGFRDLKVWQEGKSLAVDVYRLTNAGSFAKDFGLRDQIRRAAVSVPSNIAEGDERDTDREAVRFFYIAKGSVAEVLTQLTIAQEIGYIDQSSFTMFEQRCQSVAKMLSRLIASRSNSLSP